MTGVAEILAYLTVVIAVTAPLCGHHNEPPPWKRKNQP